MWFHFLVFIWQLVYQPGFGLYLEYAIVEGRKLSEVWPTLNTSRALTGELYQTSIAPKNLTGIGIQFLISKIGSQDLPKWLTYKEEGFSLIGLPLESDIGDHELFIFAMKYDRNGSFSLLGAQTFIINVIKTEKKRFCCQPGEYSLSANFQLEIDTTNLNGTERVQLYEGFTRTFVISKKSSLLFQEQAQIWNITSSIGYCTVLKEHQISSSDPNVPRLGIHWDIGCILNTTLNDTVNNIFNISSTLGGVLAGYQLAGWRIMRDVEGGGCFLHYRSSHTSDQLSSSHPPFHISSVHFPLTTTFGVIPSTTRTTDISPIQKSSSLSPLYPSSASVPSSTGGLRPTKSSDSIIEVTPSLSQYITDLTNSSSAVKYSTSLAHFSSSSRSSQVPLKSHYKRSSSVASPTQILISTTSHITTIPRNSDPIVNRPLPTLNITSCEYIFLEIPHDTFFDKEDGGTRNLTLQLGTTDFQELPSNSWIIFDQSRQVIYGVPVATQLLKNSKHGVFEYVLSAVDSGGRRVNTTVIINIIDEPHSLGQRISIKADVYFKPSSLIPLELVKLVSGYLYGGDNKTMKILDLSVVSGNPPKVDMTWSDCKAVHGICDVRRLERTSKLISVSTSIMNPQFLIVLMPKFVLRDVSEQKFGMCLNEPPLATRNVLLINITCCEKFQFQVLPDLFYDKEDGNARNLSLSLLFPNGSRLDPDSWIDLNDTSKTIRGVVSFAQARTYNLTDVVGEFLLVATDSGKLKSNMSVRVIIQHPLPSSNYHVTLILNRVKNDNLRWLQELFLVIEKLRMFFGDKSTDKVRVLSYRIQDVVSIFTWTNSTFRPKPCDSSGIANISARMKNGDGQVRQDFKESMRPEFVVQFVFGEKLGHCKDGANESPKVLLSVLRLRLNKSFTYFEYQVPVDTFHDLEDGDTRQLKLSLLSTAFDPISKNSWLVLNREKQLIYGLPDEATNRAQPTGGFRYVLVAQDSGGKLASSVLRVEIPRITEPYNYRITARIRSYLDLSLPCVDHVIKFLGKINSFTGIKDDSIRVVAYNISKTYPADVMISWSNSTESFDTCDLKRIMEIFRMFSDEKGQATKEFSDILLPYFIVQNLNLELFGSCKNSQKHAPILLTPLPVLNISVYSILEFQLPEKMFFDREDGYTRNLTVNVLDKDNQVFTCSSWIGFNNSSQTLYGIPTTTIAVQQPSDGYEIKIVATDSDGREVKTTMYINIEDKREAHTNYEIKIKATVRSNVTLRHIDQILKFFSKLKKILGKREDLILTNYTKENATLEVSFSSSESLGNECKFTEIQLLRQFLFLQNSQASQNFTAINSNGQKNSNFSERMIDRPPSKNLTDGMAPDFLVTQVMELKKGPCSNTAPVVFKALHPFVVSSYGLFSISLPLKTFYDAEDGFTSNLTVVLLSSSGKALPPDSWLQFNQTSNELHGIVTDQVILNKPDNKNYSYLLRAEDIYGLTANASLVIGVPDAPLDVGFKVSMVLRSNFSLVVSHVSIVERLSTKIAAYFKDNSTRFLNVISFERGPGIPSTDIFAWSNTTLNSEKCNLQVLNEISGKVRKSDNEPVTEFQRALLPEFNVLIVFEQRLGFCEDHQNSAPQVLNSLPTVNISVVPSTLRYQIPRNVFYDVEDGDTRNLTLSLYQIDRQDIPRNSSVQLNVPLQLIYGIFTMDDVVSKNHVKSFVLVATDSGGKTASTFLRIFIENRTVASNYQLNIKFKSYLSSSLADVAHLTDFQEKLNAFPPLPDIHVLSYSRSSGYPARFEASFINAATATSRGDGKSCDFEEITRVSDVFKDSEGKLKEDFTSSFLPGFVIDIIMVRKSGPCEVFRNYLPKLNRKIPAINISVCGTLKYQIPADTFLDKEDGNTRNLTLMLRNTQNNQSNISWIFLDASSQTLHGIPSVQISRHQSPHGYEFKLIATDSHGGTSGTTLRIFVVDPILVDSYRLTASARIPAIFRNSKPIIQKSIEFLQAIQRYLSGSISNHMRVINIQMRSSEIEVTWSNCSLGFSPCDYEKIENLRKLMIYEKTLPQPKFIQYLAPAFILESVVENMRGPCLNKGPVVKRQLSPLSARLCEQLRYTIPADTFYDSEDGYTRNLSLSLVYSNFKPLEQDFWLFFNKSSQTIIGYPNVDAASSQPKLGYGFLLNAKDQNGLSTNLEIKVFHEASVPRSNYEVTLVLHAQFEKLPNSVEQLGLILEKIARYMESQRKSIRVHSFTRARVNSTVSFLTWSNCTFPGNSCDVLGISEASRRFKDSNGDIVDAFRKVFLPEFTLQFVFEQRLGVCSEDSNFPPKAMLNLKPLVIKNTCGFWEYSVPSGLFYDQEEGYTRNLTLSIKTSNLQDLSVSSWILLDQPKQTIYGFPQLRKKMNASSEKLLVLATDTKGKFGTTTFETIFKTETYITHYSIKVEVLSYIGESSPDIYHLKKFLEILASFLDVDTESVRVISYVREILPSGSKFSISWTNCSSRMNSCDDEQIRHLQGKLNHDRSGVGRAFSQSMLPYFVPTRVTFSKFGPCQDTATNAPPKLLRPIGMISSFSGNLLWYKIPDNTFVDKEDGRTSNLTLTLQFSNKTAIPPDYWLKFDNGSHVISGVLMVQSSWNSTFRLVARDRHGNESFDSFEVLIRRKCSEEQLNYRVNMELQFTRNVGDLASGFLRKLKLYFQRWFRDTNFTIVAINQVSKPSDKYMITWSHNKACGRCDVTFIQAISRKVLHSNGTVRAEFTNGLVPDFVIINASETKCTGGTSLITMVTGGKNDRWLMYLVPIVTILAFLLFCFVFFVFRGFVSTYKSKKDKALVNEQPSPASTSPREILVENRVRSREIPLNSSNRERLTVVDEEFVANAYVNDSPEIFLDKRVSPSKESLHHMSPIITEGVPRVVKTPPLYTEAVLQLAPGTAHDRVRPGRDESAPNTRIEMKELPVVARKEVPVSGFELLSEPNSGDVSHVDGKQNPPMGYGPSYNDQAEKILNSKERIQASRSLSLESDSLDVYGEDEADTWSIFDEEEAVIPNIKPLRLPTPPSVGMLRLPPVPKQLNNSPSQSLVNTPDRESQSSSPFQTPLLTSTPGISSSTITSTIYERRPSTPSHVLVGFPGNTPHDQSGNSAYPVRSPLGIASPGSDMNGVGDRTYRGPQSPVGFPHLQERVPYVGRSNGNQVPVGYTPVGTSNDLHQALGELRETVNKELDRRTEMDKYLELYMNKR